MEIADMANIARRSYIRYEADATPPNVLSAIRIADALGVADLREIWNPAASPK
ncbi:hypothetical protein HMPREF1985_02337 [Mitsuokella sp. oral taxon 131 str. W9106]|nr:hypothetical protein HMPREF1985_02337 [Mitsuokella sp. oral taxon 131 str. W9106]